MQPKPTRVELEKAAQDFWMGRLADKRWVVLRNFTDGSFVIGDDATECATRWDANAFVSHIRLGYFFPVDPPKVPPTPIEELRAIGRKPTREVLEKLLIKLGDKIDASVSYGDLIIRRREHLAMAERVA